MLNIILKQYGFKKVIKIIINEDGEEIDTVIKKLDKNHGFNNLYCLQE